MERETAMKILKELHNKSLFAERTALETIIPELKESEDEKIRKALVRFHKSTIDIDGIKGADILAWLEKQCYTKKDVDDAYLKGIIDAKNELEKQGEQKPIDYNKELKKCRENPLYFFDKYVKLEKQKPACSEEDEKIRKEIIDFLWKEKIFLQEAHSSVENNPKYRFVMDAIAWLEKQGTPAKLSEEEQNSFAKGVLSRCALSFIDYLDAHSYEGKMCVSNGECEDIENAFHNAMWDRLHRYYCKYIEKQGEQKPAVTDFNAKDWYVSKVDGKIHDMTYNPADKIDPKFKVGDWVVTDKNDTVQIKEVNNSYYTIDNGMYFNIHYVDKYWHLWTIKDANDGDVIFDKSDGTIGIFESIGHHPDGGSYNDPSYCFLHCRYDDGYFFADFEDGNMMTSDDVIPATKEQRDTLMKAMADAGWKFDFDKKELKKIEDEIEIPFGAKDSELQEVTYYIPKGFHAEIDDDKVAIKKGEKSAAWSDEDEGIVLSIEQVIQCASSLNLVPEKLDKIDNWLKSLKDRVQPQPKQEWSEEDEKIALSIEQVMNCASLLNLVPEKIEKVRAWLKSLKDRIGG